jgi:hypothetical protein
MAWNTFRNNSDPLFSVSSDGKSLVVPIIQGEAKIIGWAVVAISDLKPDFATQRDAQRWADQQGKK